MKNLEDSQFDWNLVRALSALLTEKNVTRAASRVGITQPAMSRALGRLRHVLGDELLVRGPSGMQPTPRALELAPQVHELCERMALLMSGGRFDPKTARNTFTVVSADYGEWLVLPRLMAYFQEHAPGCSVVFRKGVSDPLVHLEDFETDLVLNPRVGPGTSLKSQLVIEETFVCIVSRTHPRLGKRRRLSTTTFCAEGHALVAPRSRPGGVVDQVLARQGRSRRVATRVPTFLVAPEVVARSELLATVPRRLAEAKASALGLRVFELPFSVPGFSLKQIWHPRRHQDPAHQFLRQTLVELLRPL